MYCNVYVCGFVYLIFTIGFGEGVVEILNRNLAFLGEFQQTISIYICLYISVYLPN